MGCRRRHRAGCAGCAVRRHAHRVAARDQNSLLLRIGTTHRRDCRSLEPGHPVRAGERLASYAVGLALSGLWVHQAVETMGFRRRADIEVCPHYFPIDVLAEGLLERRQKASVTLRGGARRATTGALRWISQRSASRPTEQHEAQGQGRRMARTWQLISVNYHHGPQSRGGAAVAHHRSSMTLISSSPSRRSTSSVEPPWFFSIYSRCGTRMNRL